MRGRVIDTVTWQGEGNVARRDEEAEDEEDFGAVHKAVAEVAVRAAICEEVVEHREQNRCLA